MFTLQAPYPSLQTTTLLPNPQLSDQEGLTATVTLGGRGDSGVPAPTNGLYC